MLGNSLPMFVTYPAFITLDHLAVPPDIIDFHNKMHFPSISYFWKRMRSDNIDYEHKRYTDFDDESFLCTNSFKL